MKSFLLQPFVLFAKLVLEASLKQMGNRDEAFCSVHSSRKPAVPNNAIGNASVSNPGQISGCPMLPPPPPCF